MQTIDASSSLARAKTPSARPKTFSYAGQTIPKVPDWAGLTALDIWFNNLSIGVFLVAAAGALCSPGRFGGLTAYAYPLALLLLIVDLALLIASLGDPLRFHHMLRVFKLSSPMSFGTWALSLYGVLLGLAAVAAGLSWPVLMPLRSALQDAGLWSLVAGVGRAAAAAAIVPASGGILYKGPLFSITSQPGWKEARWLGGYLANSAILLGCAVVVILALAGGQNLAVSALRVAMLALLVVDAVLLGLLYRNIAPAYRVRYGVNQRMFAWIVVLAFGTVVPFILLLRGTLLIAVPPFLILASALVVRCLVMLLPHPGEE